jgi:hypothetical protein
MGNWCEAVNALESTTHQFAAGSQQLRILLTYFSSRYGCMQPESSASSRTLKRNVRRDPYNELQTG